MVGRSLKTEREFESVIEFSAFCEANFSATFIISEQNAWDHCKSLLSQAFVKKSSLLLIQQGEAHKNIEEVGKCWSFLSENRADRKSLVICLGGGMLSDLAAFAAATYKRGLDFAIVPTTLLSMVDAAIGGKTAINFLGAKNQIGTFSPPVATLIRTEFLQSLPQRQLRSGYAEMIKYGFIRDEPLLKSLLSSNPTSIPNLDLIKRCREIKRNIVQEDPFEKGIRKSLNFGHTFGHALESESHAIGQSILHGEAIAWGMLAELHLSGLLFGHVLYRQFESFLTEHFSVGSFSSYKESALMDWIKADKKNEGTKIGFALIKSPGNCQTDCFPDKEQILSSLAYLRSI